MSFPQTPIEIKQGEDWTMRVIYADPSGVPINLTGYSAKMQIRANPTDLNPAATLDSTAGDQSIVITGAAGQLDLTIPKAISKLFSFATAQYDLFIYSAAGKGTPLLEGPCKLRLSATK